MNATPATNGVFAGLCQVLGGQYPAALDDCIAARRLQPLFDLAQQLDLLPALAVRCHERGVGPNVLGQDNADALRQALLDNTRRNMNISAQAIKLARLLNGAGITPLFLKGTARLLTTDAGNIGFRKQVDIDLIVQPADIEAAGNAFLADGYRYSDYSGSSGAVPTTLYDTAGAIRASAAHHHLPPLEKHGCVASVELHRHFLDKRFQRGNPLAVLFDTAQRVERHGAAFQIASAEHQIVLLVLGKFVNDGYLARRTFPIREACDLLEILENAQETVDQQFLLRRCGRSYPLFHALVCELMNYAPATGVAAREDASKFIRMMRKRGESPAVRGLLDAYARAEYLAHALRHSPAKLPAYLRRRMSSHQV